MPAIFSASACRRVIISVISESLRILIKVLRKPLCLSIWFSEIGFNSIISARGPHQPRPSVAAIGQDGLLVLSSS